MAKRLLFLCTGNYYRSRFAEILFNHHARQRGLDWHADSRALAIELGACNVGAISRYVIEATSQRQIGCPTLRRMPIGCESNDLADADLVIALKEVEHRPLLRKKFPDWENRVRYWHVHDLDAATPQEALSMIERQVAELAAELRS